MNREIVVLKEQFTHTFFKMRQVTATFQSGANTPMKQYGVSTGEVSLMEMVKGNTPDAVDNITSQDIQNWLCISKGAVSKILSSLEQKDYLKREVSQQNRRALIITLTPAGLEVVKELEGVVNDMFTELINQMGRENAEQFINSVNQFTDATQTMLEKYQSSGTTGA